jgi:hypothetical protein
MMLPISPRKQPVGRHGRRFGATHELFTKSADLGLTAWQAIQDTKQVGFLNIDNLISSRTAAIALKAASAATAFNLFCSPYRPGRGSI